MELAEFADFQKLEIRVGVIQAVERVEGTRVAAFKLDVDFGVDIGVKKTLAQLTNYPQEALIGRQVLAVVNFAPKQIGPHRSEVLVLAVPTQDGGPALVVPDRDATVGGRLF